MMVPVNQNIDEYKDDFFKGLTMRQTMYAIAAVAVSGGLMMFFLLYLKMNASVAMYITLPIVFPIIAVGFIRIHGMNFRDYMKEKRKVRQRPVFFYEPELVHQINSGELVSSSDDIIPDDSEPTSETASAVRGSGENGTNKVFSYTCEAPKGGTDAAEKLTDKSKYYCIHNLINAVDLVPRVAPYQMGFKRYGVDHYIPGTDASSVVPYSVTATRAANGSAKSCRFRTYSR